MSVLSAIHTGNMTGVHNSGIQNPLCNVLTDISGLVNAMLLNHNMPKQEINHFNGDPAEYYMFIYNFEVNIESKVIDPKARFTYLLKFCKGKARKPIENCVLLGANGYVKACEILQMQFGHPHVVAHGMLEKLCSRGQVKANDPDALWDVGREIQQCEITLNKISAHASIDQLLKIQRILPSRLQGDWAKRAKVLMQNGREPTIEDMSKFIQDAVLIGSTVYGRCVGQGPINDSKSKVKYKSGGEKSASFVVQTGSSNNKYQTLSKLSVGTKVPCVCCSGRQA